MVIALHPNFSTEDERLGASSRRHLRHRRGGHRRLSRASAADPGLRCGHTFGIDVGGHVHGSRRSPTRVRASCASTRRPTHAERSVDGIAARPRELAEQRRAGPRRLPRDQVGLIVHGTTVTTNACSPSAARAPGSSPPRGSATSSRCAAACAAGRHLYDNKYVAAAAARAPLPAAAGARAVDVRRQRADAARRATPSRPRSTAARREGVEAVAVCFMHAYANAAHERARGADRPRARARASSSRSRRRSCRRSRLNERVVDDGDERVRRPGAARATSSGSSRRWPRRRFGGILLVMQSNGGVATPEIVAHDPRATVLSGPAGGPVAGLAYARAAGVGGLLIVDMGGTSFDASLVKDGEVPGHARRRDQPPPDRRCR